LAASSSTRDVNCRQVSTEIARFSDPAHSHFQ
jgi:hypothetical protein